MLSLWSKHGYVTRFVYVLKFKQYVLRRWSRMAAVLEMASTSCGTDMCEQHVLPKSFMVDTNTDMWSALCCDRKMKRIIHTCQTDTQAERWGCVLLASLLVPVAFNFFMHAASSISSKSLMRHWAQYKHVSIYRNVDMHAAFPNEGVSYVETTYVHLFTRSFHSRFAVRRWYPLVYFLPPLPAGKKYTDTSGQIYSGVAN